MSLQSSQRVEGSDGELRRKTFKSFGGSRRNNSRRLETPTGCNGCDPLERPVKSL